MKEKIGLGWYKNDKSECVSGVLLGFSEMTGIDITILRIIFAGMIIFAVPYIVIIYMVLAIVLPSKKEAKIRREEKLRDLGYMDLGNEEKNPDTYSK